MRLVRAPHSQRAIVRDVCIAARKNPATKAMNVTAKVVEAPDMAEFVKQVKFGVVLGLKNTAVEAQKAVVKSLGDNFTLRGQWFQESNKYGIRIKPPTKDRLVAEITTAADWLNLHEDGGIKSPLGNHLAIPTQNARPNPGARIPEKFMPKALINTGKAFIEKFKNGTLALSVHGLTKRGKFSDVVVMYFLVPRARIKKQSTFYDPIKKVVDARLVANIEAGIAKAFATGGSLRGRIGSYGPR